MAWGIEGDLGGIEQTLDRLYNAAEKATAKGLYKGAGVVADNLNASLNSIHTEVFEYATDGYKRPPSPEEKAVLQSSAHGIAKFHSNGIEMDTSVGFDDAGYATFGKGSLHVVYILQFDKWYFDALPGSQMSVAFAVFFGDFSDL